MKLITSTNKLNPLHPEFDQTLSALATSIVNGLGVLPESNGVETAYKVPDQFLTLETADLLHSKGVTIKNFPLFIEIDSKDSPNAFSVVDENGKTLSWSEWKLENHTFYESSGKVFVGTNAHTNEDMDYADLLVVRDKLSTSDMLPNE